MNLFPIVIQDLYMIMYELVLIQDCKKLKLLWNFIPFQMNDGAYWRISPGGRIAKVAYTRANG